MLAHGSRGKRAGVWLHTRYGIVQQYEGLEKYQHDCRVIVNYDFPLL